MVVNAPADDDTDCHVHYVAAQRKGLELFDKLFQFVHPIYIINLSLHA